MNIHDALEREQENPEAMPKQIYDYPEYYPYRGTPKQIAPNYAHRQVKEDRYNRYLQGWEIVFAVAIVVLAVVVTHTMEFHGWAP